MMRKGVVGKELKQCRFLGKFRGCVFFYTPCIITLQAVGK